MSNSKLTRRSLLGSAAGFVLVSSVGPAHAKGPIYVTADQIRIDGGRATIANKELAASLKEGDEAALKLLAESGGRLSPEDIEIDGSGRVLISNEAFAIKIGQKTEGKDGKNKINIICGGGC